MGVLDLLLVWEIEGLKRFLVLIMIGRVGRMHPLKGTLFVEKPEERRAKTRQQREETSCTSFWSNTRIYYYRLTILASSPYELSL